MDAFEYLSVLISIVLGLGITQLLSAFGRWLEQRRDFLAYSPAIVWAAFLLIVHVQTWWAMFGLRHYDDWNFLQFSVVLLQPILLYLLAILVLPGPNAAVHDLRANWHTQRPWFFGLFLTLLVVSVLKDLVRSGTVPEAVNLAFHGVLFAIAAIALGTRRDHAQRALAWGALLVITAYIFLLFAELQVTSAAPTG